MLHVCEQHQNGTEVTMMLQARVLARATCVRYQKFRLTACTYLLFFDHQPQRDITGRSAPHRQVALYSQC
jgi:hypothetical protein